MGVMLFALRVSSIIAKEKRIKEILIVEKRNSLFFFLSNYRGRIFYFFLIFKCLEFISLTL